MTKKKGIFFRNFLIMALIAAISVTWTCPPAAVWAAEEEAEEAAWQDGTYEGTGTGRNGDITVSVVIDGGKIASVEILDQKETPEYWETLIGEDGENILTQRIVGAQSAQVDAVTGATRSSEGIMAAVSDALAKSSVRIGGSGTAKDPYVIRDARQLQSFAQKIDEGDADYISASVVLGADIDLSEAGNWNPIGAEGKTNRNTGKLFAGSFAGRGRTISGMHIAGSYAEETNLGLFSSLGSTARIRDVILQDVTIDAENTGDWAALRAGSIAGDTARTSEARAAVVDGCTVSGTIRVKTADGQATAGGVLGRAFTKSAVINCVSRCSVSADAAKSGNAAYAGGICGMTGNDTVMANCVAFGDTQAANFSGGADAYAGGIAGMMTSTLYNCCTAGSVAIGQKAGVSSQYAGALAGQLAASPGGAFNYFSSEASITVTDENGNASAVEPRAWSADDLTGKATAEDVLSAYQALSDAYHALADAMNASRKDTADLTAALQALDDSISRLQKAETAEKDALEDQVEQLQGTVDELQGSVDGLQKAAAAAATDISNFEATLSRASFPYTGRAIRPSVKVKGLKAGDYTVSYTNNVKIGTAKVSIKGNAVKKYSGTISKTFQITKKRNTMAVKVKTVKAKAKKKTTIKAKKAFKVTKAVGKVTYKKVSGNKKITVAKNGKITVKKGLKKKTYKIRVAVRAAGSATYAPAAQVKTVKIRVR